MIHLHVLVDIGTKEDVETNLLEIHYGTTMKGSKTANTNTYSNKSQEIVYTTNSAKKATSKISDRNYSSSQLKGLARRT